MLVAAGVLDGHTAAVWRRAILRAADDAPPVSDADLRRRVEVIIEQLGSTHLRYGALDLAVALGAMSPHDRLRRGLGGRHGMGLEAVHPGAVGSLPVGGPGDRGWAVSVGGAAGLAEDQPLVLSGGGEREHAARGALVRVLPAPTERHRGVRLTSIAIHEHATVVRWHALPDDNRGPGFDLTIGDDVGTVYGRGEPAGSRGNRFARSGATAFPVPVPPGTRELRLTWCGGTSACRPAGV